MNILFSKYQGAGNDFILINDTDNNFPEKDHDLIQKLCDRKFGIGADGLMLLRDSQDKDFTMLYFNADGYEGTMCGNGGRCLVAYARDCGHTNKLEGIVFDAIDGEHSATIINEGLISLKMKDVFEIKNMGAGYGVDTGSIHHVEYVDNLVDMDVCGLGRAIREHKMYSPEGCNVNFIKAENSKYISIRTYERGVENETLACGTGSVASAIVHHHRGFIFDVRFKNDGKKYYDIWLEGPAVFVFKGEWKQ